MTVEHTIQTNGTLLDDEWAAFFAEHDFLVGHQHRRPAASCTTPTASTRAASRPSTGCMRGLGRLQRARRRVERADHGARRQRRPPGWRSTGSCATSAARAFIQFIPIVERPAGRRDGLVPRTGATARHRSALASRPLDASSTGAFLDRGVRGVGAPRRRRGLRADVRRRARELARRAAGAVRPRRDLRHGARAGAQRRPVLVRPLRRAGLPARQHHRDADGRAGRTPQQQRRSAQDKRDTLPALLPRVRRALRLPRRLPQGPVHPRRPTASPASTTCAPATRRSSTTSTGRCASWPSCLRRGPGAVRDHGAGTPPRTPGAAATTPARAAAARSGSTATVT